MLDLIGQQFGRLIVVKRIVKDKCGKYKWLCKCRCGKETIVRGPDLKNGHTQSCGCLQREIATQGSTKHGYRYHKIYSIWNQMIQRCTNHKCKDYQNYGGIGITICKRWMKPENFLKDMIKKWKHGLTLERRENHEGYCPENCYWATPKQQARNRRNNHLITHNGKTQLLIEWSEETGISESTIRWRLNNGWSSERAFTK